MHKPYLITLLVYLIASTSLCAQQPVIPVVEKIINNLRSHKTLQYDKWAVSKNPFSEGDTIRSATTSLLIFNSEGNVSAAVEVTGMNNGQSKVKEVLWQNSWHTFDLADSTYSVADSKAGNFKSEFTKVADLLDNQTKAQVPGIFLGQDSLVNNIICYNFFIKEHDTVVNGTRNYIHKQLLIDKATLNPLYFKEVGEGVAEKGGFIIGRLQFFNESRFSNIVVNGEINPSVFNVDRTGFTELNTAMLSPGTIAPLLELKDLEDKAVSTSSFKDKLLLIEFGSTVCAANPLANPMLNRLYERYKFEDVAIISIYADETPEQVSNYVNSNGLLFPVYLGTKKLKKAYSTVGVPNFYLLDKGGKVIESINGYSGDLEASLERKIDSLLSKK